MVLAKNCILQNWHRCFKAVTHPQQQFFAEGMDAGIYSGIRILVLAFLQTYHIVSHFSVNCCPKSKLSNSNTNKAVLPPFLSFLVLIVLSACGGTAQTTSLSKSDDPVIENGVETAVSPNTAQVVSSPFPLTPETAAPISTDLPADVDETQPESTPINIAPAATTTFDQAGLSDGGGNFISLDDPEMIAAAAATWLDGDDIVIGVVQNGEARAYPIKQAAYHHVINDTIGGEPYLVTY